jgi:hypothetical protein
MNQTQLRIIMKLVSQWSLNTKYRRGAEVVTHLEWMDILTELYEWPKRAFIPDYRWVNGTLRATWGRLVLMDMTTYMDTCGPISITDKTSIVSLPYRSEL